MSGGSCEKRLVAKVKGKIWKRVMRPAMLFAMEMLALTKRQEAELKMVGLSLGVTRMDRIRNEHIRRPAQVERFGHKVREGRLRWCGDVQKRNSKYIL